MAEPIRLVGKTQTIDIETGQVIEEHEDSMVLMPPDDIPVCRECAVRHDPAMAHNRQSLYYQMAFHARNGRYPTWTDAMAHCTADVRAEWTRVLIRNMNDKGIPIPDDLASAAAPDR